MLKVTIKTPQRHHWRRSVDFNVNFGHVSQVSSVSFVELEQPNVSQDPDLFNQ